MYLRMRESLKHRPNPRHSAWPARCHLAQTVLVLLILLAVVCGAPVRAGDCSSDASFTVYPTPADPADPNNLYLLNLLTLSSDADHNTALWAGVSAALSSAAYTTTGGHSLYTVSPTDPTSVSDAGVFVTAAMLCDYKIIAAVGPYSDADLLSVQAAMARAAYGTALKGLLLIGPATLSSAVRTWNANTYFLRPDPLTELMALVRHLLTNVAARRVGIMYLQGADFGAAEAQRANALLTAAGRTAATVYAPRYKGTDGTLTDLDEALFQKFAQSELGAIIVLGMPGQHTRDFIKQCLTNSKTSAATLLTTLAVQEDMATVVQALVAAGTLPASLSLVISGTNYLASQSTDYAHIARFQVDMNDYIASGTSPYPVPATGDTPLFLRDSKLGERQVMGWICGQVLLQMLAKEDTLTNTESFRVAAFNQARYVVQQDFVVGDFGGPCVGSAAVQGAACSCNQGGRTTLLKNMDAAGEITLNAATPFTYPSYTCYSTALTLPKPVLAAALSYTDDPDALLMFSQSELGLNMLAANTVAADSSIFSTNAHTFSTTTSTATSDLAQYQTRYSLDVFVGPLHDSVVPSSIVALGPMYTSPQLHSDNTNIVYLMPTLEQQTYIAYEYIDVLLRKGLIDASKVTVIVRGTPASVSSAIQTLLDATAAAFDMPNPAFHVLDADTSASDVLAPSGITIFLGFGLNDVSVAYDFLKAHTGAYILADYTSYATAYPSLLTAFTASAADPTLTSRFTTPTNLPLWNKNTDAGHAESALLAQFHTAVPDAADQTPRSLEMYVVVQLVASLGLITTLSSSAESTIADDTVLQSFYRGSVYYVNELRLGPYMNCAVQRTSSCTDRNFGASKIGVTSFANVFDFSRALELMPMEATLNYTVNKVTKRGISTGQIVGIAVGCAAAVALLIAIGIIIFCCCCDDSRDNKNAPKVLADPVTLVFTDIESSTALWAACPTIMPDAVATHHKLIRQLIASYKCYEVKTIGDSFMIACKSPGAAVMVARGIQTKFLKHDWKTTSIDEAYRSFETQKAEEEEGYLVRSALLSAEDYAKVWSGLRVRVGIHTGLSDIRQDEITKGYDYYGETSNMAARTEAIANGGQVIMTGSTWWALSQQERDMFHCTNFGPQGLRGVPYGVEMYQLEVVRDRIYGDLRTEIELEFDDELHSSEEGRTGSRYMLESMAGTMTRGASAVAAVLTSCFCVYPTRQRVKELQPLLIRWGVSVPERRGKQDDLDDYCRLLINLVALKIATVSEAQMRIPEPADSLRLSGYDGTGRGDAGGDESQHLLGDDHKRESVEMSALGPRALHAISVDESDAVHALQISERRRSSQTASCLEADFANMNGLSLWRQAHGRSRRYRHSANAGNGSAEREDEAENPFAVLNPIAAHVGDDGGDLDHDDGAVARETDPVFKRIPLDMLEDD